MIALNIPSVSSMTLPLVCVFLASLLFCLVLTPVARALAQRCRLVDQPDKRRKMHGRAVPVAGGLPILLSACVALAGVLWYFPPPAEIPDGERPNLLGLLFGALFICMLGLADDFGYLRGRHKLVGQCLAVGIVIFGGVRVEHIHLFNWTMELGLLSVPFTGFILLGAINSLNLIDGMDGLLSSVGLIITLAMGILAAVGHHWAAACIALALAGALLGFLRYNFPPASIFLGDAGSMLIGLVVGVLAIESSLKAPATIALAAPTALLTIPAYDTLAAILRRKLTGRSIYTTDRGHLHHVLLRRGMNTHMVLLLISALCLVTVAGVLISLTFKNELFAILSAVTVVGILLASRLFGHGELSLLSQHVRSLLMSFLGRTSADGSKQSEVRIQGSLDWTELWAGVTDLARQLNLKAVRLDVNAPALHEGYHARWDRGIEESEEQIVWSADIPLTAGQHTIGRLEVVGYQDAGPVWMKIQALSRMVQTFEMTADLLINGSWAEKTPAYTRVMDQVHAS
jgi:UDP-GlcNAc:undecaprenyl-phosphate/decaprenyl-phosphate GlcNAc-1-phosphate transferase